MSKQDNKQDQHLFRSTDIHRTKSASPPRYFPERKPRPKRPKPPNRPKSPAARRSLRKKITKYLAIALSVFAVTGLIIFAVFFINQKIQEQQDYEKRTAAEEGSAAQPISIPGIRARAEALVAQESEQGLSEALTLLDNYLVEISDTDPEATFTLQLTKAELIHKHGNDPQGSLDQLLPLDRDDLRPLQQYLLYKAISSNYQDLGDFDQVQSYSDRAQSAYQQAKDKGEFAQHGL